MGFLDKALRAATAAKDQIDEVRELRASTQHRPVEATALDEHEEHVLARARELGAPDPFWLLSVEEASEVVGVPLGGPRITYGDDTIGVAFAADGPKQRRWSVEVQAFHAGHEDDDFDAVLHWHHYVAEHVIDDGWPVAGLGDAAIARDGEVFVLADPLLFWVTVRTPDGTRTTDQAIAAARQTLTRLD